MFLQELSRNATLAAFQQELSFQHPDFLFPLCLAWTNLPREKARWEGRRCTHSAHPVRSVSHEEARRTAVQSGAVCLLSSALPAPLPTHTHASTHARMHTLNYHTKPSSMLRPGEHFSAYRLIARSSPNKAQRQRASNNARTDALKKKKGFIDRWWSTGAGAEKINGFQWSELKPSPRFGASSRNSLSLRRRGFSSCAASCNFRSSLSSFLPSSDLRDDRPRDGRKEKKELCPSRSRSKNAVWWLTGKRRM